MKVSDIFMVTSNVEVAGKVDNLEDMDLKQILEKIAENSDYQEINKSQKTALS